MKQSRNPRSELSPDMAAFDRLYQDGAHSVAAVRRRVALFAAERQLDAAETKALLKGRLTVRHIGPFIEKYHLSADWLLAGDLKGRLRMARKDLAPVHKPSMRLAEPEPPAIVQSRAVHAVLKTLNDRELRAVKRVMAALHSAEPA